jgi:hypothetical protein
MSASPSTKLRLAHRSGGICALCHCELSPESDKGDPINVGKAAHIAGEHDGKGKVQRSARFDPNMTPEQRDHISNLIYLCGTCHDKIDAIPEGERDYPIFRLHAIKKEHEAKRLQAMLDAFADVGFPELEEATKWVTSVTPPQEAFDYSLLKLEDKIRRNELDAGNRSVIAMGLGVASEVARHIESVAQGDPDFPERLKAGFLAQYWRFRREGSTGSELFELMCAFAKQGFRRQAEQSAGIAVLVHLFETCDVFEK